MHATNILVISPHAAGRRGRSLFSRHPFVTFLTDFPHANEISLTIPRDFVVIEIHGQDAAPGAIQFVRELRAYANDACIILIVADSSEDLAIAALNAGVTRYLKTPVEEEFLESLLIGSEGASVSASDAPVLRGGERLIGKSPPVCALRAAIARAARCTSNVLITGETGTGKELVAELIHENSARAKGPFVSLNSTAIPDSLVESELFGYERGAFTGAHTTHQGKLAMANMGTIVFDEIGDISASVQAKLLRALDGKEVYRLGSSRPVSLDVRVLAATNHDLEMAVKDGSFRRDLYYRLNVIRFDLPPLRDRPEDIPELVRHYIAVFNRSFGARVETLTREAFETLAVHDWPGNIRELRNVMELIFVNLPSVAVARADLPLEVRRHMARTAAASPGERDRLVGALISTRWNKTRAADKLRWSRMTLYRKMMRYNIARSQEPDAGEAISGSTKALAATDQSGRFLRKRTVPNETVIIDQLRPTFR